MDAKPQHAKDTFVGDLGIGAASSAITNTLTYPIHRVKVILQTQDINPKVLSNEIPRYNFLNTFQRLTKEQGILSLWRGNTPYLLRHIPGTSLGFAFKDKLHRLLPAYDPQHNFWQFAAANILSGSIAGGCALAFVYPMELVTVRMAADLGPGTNRQFGNGIVDCWYKVVQREGFLASYRGLPIALMSIMTYRGLYFGLFDTFKHMLNGQGHTFNDVFHKWVLAQSTVYVASTVSYPLDVIRKRLIVDVASSEPQYRGTLDCIRRIARTEGVKGFFRFYGYDMVFRLGSGLVLVLYDELKTTLHHE